jgi:hypothetical protein
MGVKMKVGMRCGVGRVLAKGRMGQLLKNSG